MSTDSVDSIHLRLREEIDRVGLSLAAAARAAGESSPQRIKDVVSGKQRCPSDLLARLNGTGVDIFYVLTGQRSDEAPAAPANPREKALLDNYRHSPDAGKDAIERTASALAQSAAGCVKKKAG
ncbi:hypothetical protein ACNQFN_18845 [Thauera butanivorans]|uniref:hypothetical protein n=1 Tax=Thauera butanivorans TaxID=86174 RepID=UPI003AB48A9C